MEWPYIDIWVPTLSGILGLVGKLSELLIECLFVSFMTVVSFFMQVLSKDSLR